MDENNTNEILEGEAVDEKTTKELLDEVIFKELERIKTMPDGDKKNAAVENVMKLYRLKTEENKVEGELEIRKTQVEIESECKVDELLIRREELDERKKYDLCRSVTDTCGIVFPIIFYGKWLRRGFEFEEKGAITSFTFRNLISKFKPTRR